MISHVRHGRIPAIAASAANLLILALVVLGVISPPSRAAEITGVSILSFSSQLPGTVQPCCDRRATYLLGTGGLNINGPGTHTWAPDATSMWLSDQNPNIASQFVSFDLGAVYDLEGTRIWNYNEINLLIRGVYQMRILVSLDNVTYRDLGIFTLDKAPDPASQHMDFSQYIPLNVSNVRYVRFEVLSSHGDTIHVGLSKVRFFNAPAAQTPVTSGRILHLDASDVNGDGGPTGEPIFGTTVSTWTDKSGAGNNGTAVGNPSLIAGELNGRPVVRFDGNDQFNLPGFSALTQGEIFILIRTQQYPNSAAATTGIWDMGTAAAQSHYSWIPGDDTIYDTWGTNVRNDGILPTVPLDQWNVYNVRSIPGQWTCWLNGVLQRNRASNTVTFPGASVIGRSFAGIFLAGDIAEVIMYNRGLSQAERDQVNDYLRRKYNLGDNYNGPQRIPPIREGVTIHLDAPAVSHVGDSAALARWIDRSGKANRASTSNDPLWIRNSMGGNAAVRFNGNDEYTLGNLSAQFPTGATAFIVTSINSDAAYNIFDTLNNDPWWRWDGNGFSYPGVFRNPRIEAYSGAMPTSGQHIFMIESTATGAGPAASAFWRMFENNISRGNGAVGYSPGNDYRVSGAFGVAQKFLSGDIAEVLVYDRAFSDVKKGQIGSYLKEKYRINTRHSNVPVLNGRILHLAADAIPNAADGGVVSSWVDMASGLTATGAGDPNYRANRINGKPVVELDGSGDTFSVPLATTTDMTFFAVARATNYQSMIRWQPSSWIVYPWGNGDLIQELNGGTGAGINAGFVPEEWNVGAAVIDTGATSGVKTYRNGQLRGQRTYSNNWGPLSPLWIGSINGGGEFMVGDIAEIIIYNRALNDTERRLVERYLMEKYGLDGRGPGGLYTADLEIWLRADKGALFDANRFVYEWDDLSGFNRYIYQPVASQRPDWVPNAVNGLPVLRFNPNGDTGSGTLVEYFRTDGLWPAPTTGASVFWAAKSNINDTFGYQSIVRYQGASWLIYPWLNQMIINPDSGTTGVVANLDPLIWNIGEGLYRANTTNGFQTFKNGTLQNQKNSANITLQANNLLIGACCGTTAINNESPNADIGEIIVYSNRVNEAQRILVENYLSARFDKALTGSDIYAGDTAGNGNYDWEMAGIGRIGTPVDWGDGANPFGAGRHLIGNSSGFIIEEISYLQDSGDFLVAGHNGLLNDLTNADLVGSGAQNRWSRIWYLHKTDVNGNGGQVNLRFDFSDAKVVGARSGAHVLLRRSGTTGNFNVVAVFPSVLGDEYTFTLNAASLTTGYFTLAETDVVRPVITLTGGDLNIQCGSGYTDPGFTATDNSDGNINANVIVTGSVNPNVTGVYTIRYNVSDTAGNTAIERVRTVTIFDTLPPAITRNGVTPVTVECTAAYIDAGATASDQCNGNLTGAIVVGGLPINTGVVGPNLVTYNVTDLAGLPAAQVTRNVNVVDTTPPLLTLTGGNLTLECGVDTFSEPGASAFDDCAGFVPVVIGGNTVNPGIPGVYVITYNATDGTNASPQQTRTVTVQDTLGPAITLNGSANETHVAGQPYTDQGASAFDDCEGAVPVIVGGDTVNIFVLNTYVITYNAIDGGGRPAVQRTRNVTVVAGNPPSILLTGDPIVTLECNSGPYADAGATATDVEDDDLVLTGNIVVGGLPIDTGTPGTYTITYNVTDTSGNPASEVTRTVIVEDTQDPSLTLLGNPSILLQCGDSYTDAGAEAADSCDDDAALTATIVVTGLPIPTGTPGVYTINYNVSDSSGNPAAPVSRTVTVQDNTAPEISLIGDAFVPVDCGDTYDDAGATATDNCDNDLALTSAISVAGLPIPTGTPGTYFVTYNVQDISGNPALQVTRTVEVSDTAPPVISLNGPGVIPLRVGNTYIEQGASALDDCDLNVPVVITGTVNTAAVGVYTVRYNATDDSGNPAVEVIRLVNVTEGTPPVITQHPQSLTVNYNTNAVFTITAVTLGPITYQWLKDGAPISNGAKYTGVTTATLTVLNCANADEGDFRCQVTGDGPSVLSLFATLTVNDPGIVTQPVSQIVQPGTTANFSVVAVGSGTLSYQWYRNNLPLANAGTISGALSANLSIANAQENIDEAEYYVVVDGGVDPPIESVRVTLTVGNPIVITQPQSLTIGQGATAVFQIQAIGVPPLFYRWRRNGENLTDGGRYSGVSTPTLTITNAQDSDEGEFSCRVVGQNIVESNTATLTVLGPPVLDGIRVLPASGIVAIQGPAALTVIVVEGLTPFTFQWRKGGVPITGDARITGVNSATLNIGAAQTSDSGFYDCIVTNSVGTATAAPVQLRVGLTFVDNLFNRTGEETQPFRWSVRVDGGAGVVFYQWYKDDGSKTFVPLTDGSGISGTTTNTLEFSALQFSDAGLYRVDVSDDYDVLPSNAAVLTVVVNLPVVHTLGLAAIVAALSGLASLALRRRMRTTRGR